MLAVAVGAWALFGRSGSHSDTPTAIGPKVPTGTSAPQQPIGPIVPGTTPKPTTAGPAATPVATASPTPAPSQALVATPSVRPVATSPALQPKPVIQPPVTSPQQGGTAAKKAFTFKVTRGDTLWGFTKTALRSTGRATSNADIAAYVAKLYSANKSLIGPDPNLILVGQTISWPAGL
ncbi:MAG: Peptidoglycan-binding lysin domain protein [Frankiales bacterium]|nr:Peptidoglycan-binding lysin domain protein [Frankiales bacterium]